VMQWILHNEIKFRYLGRRISHIWWIWWIADFRWTQVEYRFLMNRQTLEHCIGMYVQDPLLRFVVDLLYKQCCHKYSTKVLKYKYKYTGLKSTLSTSTSTYF